MTLDRFQEIQREISCHAETYGRDAGAITLVAVSKRHKAAAIRALAGAGQRDFGESYASEGVEKIIELNDLALTWHFIGPIQSNKTQQIASYFQWAHSVDRVKIVRRLARQRPPDLPPLQVCLQLKVGDETTKSGAAGSQLSDLAAEVSESTSLQLRGLMVIPPFSPERAQQIHYFQAAVAASDQLKAEGFALDTLSMGMSGDMQAAIATGSTMVRIGTAIFGERSG